jgi:hypothetical protein
LKTDSPHKTIRVLIHGLAYFSGMFPSILQGDGWDVKQYPPRWSPDLLPMVRCLRDSDLTFLWGGRVTQGKFLSTARLFGKEKIVMFWCGSDVVQGQWERNAGKMDPWVAERIHWAGSPWLADEVRALGLPCEYVPATWVPMVDHFEPLPNKFSVLAFLPLADRMKLYGIDQVLDVALSLPTIEFNIVGLRRGQRLSVPANVRLHGWTPDLSNHLKNTTVMWRPARHDGLSFMALEALAHARHVLWSYPFEHSIFARGARAAQTELERLHELHRAGNLHINLAGAEHVRRNFSPAAIRENILGRWRAIVESPSPAASLGYSPANARNQYHP